MMQRRQRLVVIAGVCVAVGIAAGIGFRLFKTQSQLPPSGSFNALFNQTAAGEFGLWIYSGSGGCPDLRSRDLRPLVLVSASPAPKGKIAVTDLKTCIELDRTDAKQPRVTKCSNGYVVFEAAGEKMSERFGSYLISLVDGRTRQGEFRAALCAEK